MKVIFDNNPKEYEVVKVGFTTLVDGRGINIQLKTKPSFRGFRYGILYGDDGEKLIGCEFYVSTRESAVIISRDHLPLSIIKKLCGVINH